MSTDATGATSRHRPVFDAHLHIIDPRFRVTADDGYLPPTFTVEDYTQRTADLGIVGGAVVSGSFQGFDQDYLLDALGRLGPGFIGVTQVPATFTDKQLLALDEGGVRAVRFNVCRGGSETLDHLDTLARRVYDLAGWHVELYVDAGDLPDLMPTLGALPAVSIDHLGLSADGLPHLLRLVEQGARVKATGFGRVELDVPTALRAIADVNEHALMFGTDLPSTRARRPFQDSDVDVLTEALGGEPARAVLYANAAAFYRLHHTTWAPDDAGRIGSR